MNETQAHKSFWYDLANGLSAIFGKCLESIFGPAVTQPAFGKLTWEDIATVVAIILLLLLAHGIAALYLRKKMKAAASSETKELPWHQFAFVLAKPLYAFIWVGGIYLAVAIIFRRVFPPSNAEASLRVLGTIIDIGVFLISFWLFIRLTRLLEARLTAWSVKRGSKIDQLFVPLLGKCLRVIVPVVAVILALPVIGLPAEYAGFVTKGTSILLIVAVAVILFQAIGLGENVVLLKFDITTADNLQARKIRTQVQVMSKTAYFLIGLFTIASILMLFQEVRHLGTSLLASAGVVGIIVGFAAQKTIANLFAGFQIALAQPIRLDDVVIVEGEWGRIEEITLTYVVIHIWDDRRLVVPLSDFIEKPFQNWTRTSAELLGSVLLWVDYSLPVAETREATRKIVESCALWDKRFWNLQVSDATEHTMQIRVLCTAADASKAWDLRCEVREKLISYIQDHHPKSLPRVRADWQPPASTNAGNLPRTYDSPPPNLIPCANGKAPE